MYNRENIMEIIDEHQQEIDVLEAELKTATSESVIGAIKDKLSFLYDNQYRYKLQARAWGLINF